MPDAKPNILFIMADQLAARYLGAYGHPLVKTPHLDRLAAEGVVFENAYTPSPLCAPARATTMTGLLPSRTGVQGIELQSICRTSIASSFTFRPNYYLTSPSQTARTDE